MAHERTRPTKIFMNTDYGELAKERYKDFKDGYNKAIDKACEWLIMKGVWSGTTCGELKEYIEDFRKAMVISGNKEEIPSNSCKSDKNLQELSWQDIKRIIEIADKILDCQTMGFLATEEFGWSSEEAYYTEVLRRYKEKKEE